MYRITTQYVYDESEKYQKHTLMYVAEKEKKSSKEISNHLCNLHTSLWSTFLNIYLPNYTFHLHLILYFILFSKELSIKSGK